MFNFLRNLLIKILDHCNAQLLDYILKLDPFDLFFTRLQKPEIIPHLYIA